MEDFELQGRFRFRAESLEAAGAEIRRLQEAAEQAGFEMSTGTVVPAPPDDEPEDGWTGYAPI